MDIKAEQKFLLLSPKKIRPVVAVIKKMKPTEAVLRLPFIGKKAAEPLVKVIKQALANAKNKAVSEENLIFKEIQIGEGPRLKRGIPVSKGQWHPILKRMSHIRIILTTVEPKKKENKEKKVQTKKIEKKGKENGTKN
jgi:large subunit ribosomal protein L22